MMYLALVVFVVLPSVFVAWLLGSYLISGERVTCRAQRALLWAWPLALAAIGLLVASNAWSRRAFSWAFLDEFLIRLAEHALLLLPLVFSVLFIVFLIVFSGSHREDRMSSAYLLVPLGYAFLAFMVAAASPLYSISNYRIWKYDIPPLERQFGFKLGKGGRGVVFTWVNPDGPLGRAGIRAGDSVRAHHGVVGFYPLFLLALNGGPVSVESTPLSEHKRGWDTAKTKSTTWIVEQTFYERLASRDTGDILREYLPLLAVSDRDYEALVALEFVALKRGAEDMAPVVPILIRRLIDLDDGPKHIAPPLRINVARILGEMGPLAREAVPALKAAVADPRSGADPDALSIPEYADDPEIFRSAAIEALRRIEAK